MEVRNAGTSQLFIYVNNTLAVIVPPICAVYVLAIFWDRTSEQGAFWGLMTGQAVGLVRFAMDLLYSVPPCGSGVPDLRPHWVKVLLDNVHHLHFACILWVLTAAVTTGISLMTPPVQKDDLCRLTWSNRRNPQVLARSRSKTVAPTLEIYSVMDIQEHPSGGSTREVESRGMSLLKRLCGAKELPDNSSDVAISQLTEEQKARAAAAFLNEPPFWKNVVTVNAIICLTLSTFVYGFFA